MDEHAVRVPIVIRDAKPEDGLTVETFLSPFVEAQQILARSREEIQKLLEHGFVAEHEGQMVGFAAVEPYSRKMAELQCLAVSAGYRRQGIGSRLIRQCVMRAQQLGIYELMAITSSEEPFRACGFDYSLPQQKRALFVHPKDFRYP